MLYYSVLCCEAQYAMCCAAIVTTCSTVLFAADIALHANLCNICKLRHLGVHGKLVEQNSSQYGICQAVFNSLVHTALQTDHCCQEQL